MAVNNYPADVSEHARREMGLTRKMGGTRRYPVWFRMEESAKNAASMDTCGASPRASIARCQDQLDPSAWQEDKKAIIWLVKVMCCLQSASRCIMRHKKPMRLPCLF